MQEMFSDFYRSCCGMEAIIAQILRPHVRRFGGELALHAGFHALASSLVPDPRVRWSSLRCHATDDGWCIFEVVQAVAIDPKTFVLAKCCAMSSLVRFAQHSGKEAQPCGSDHCHARCCWHSSALAMRRKPVPLFTLFCSMILQEPL